MPSPPKLNQNQIQPTYFDLKVRASTLKIMMS